MRHTIMEEMDRVTFGKREQLKTYHFQVTGDIGCFNKALRINLCPYQMYSEWYQ